MSSKAMPAYLPVLARTNGVAPLDPAETVAPIQRAGEIVSPERFAKLMPRTPTWREKRAGKELAYRAAVQEGHVRLQQAAAVAIAQLHDHTHRVVAAEVLAMNRRVRAIADPDDRTELAAISAEQKAMFLRHQFGVLEAGCYRVAAEVDRPLYEERRRGLLGWLLGE